MFDLTELSESLAKGVHMRRNPFVGNWVYRSLYNTVDEPHQIEDLMLWQATLTLEDSGPSLIKGKLSSGAYALDVRGAVGLGTATLTIEMRATGIEGSPTAGWVYDYSGYLTYHWPEGDGQRPAIVGTVTRTVPHSPNRPAGASYSFVAVNQDIPPEAYKLPEPIVMHFADKVHRLHHAVWHGVRELWDDLKPEERAKLKDLDWQIEGGRVALISSSQKTRPMLENGSGEDFLFFHRQMVAHYRMMMTDLGAKIIEWPEIPQPGAGGVASPDVVPESWNIPEAPNFERRLAALKTDDFFWSRMRWWDVEFKNQKYLATLTLGEFGALLQYTIHNDMHIRWSAPPRDPETNALLPLGRPDEDISDRWDNPRYDWLGEFYSSHVNTLFWRLHGWIDDRIEDWAAAHEWSHPGSVKRFKLGGVNWFKPGKWVQVEYPWVWPRSLGGLEQGMGDDTPEMRAKKIASMKQVMAILFPPSSQEMLMRASTGPGTGQRFRRTSVIGLF
jgi:hypothetical protein